MWSGRGVVEEGGGAQPRQGLRKRNDYDEHSRATNACIHIHIILTHEHTYAAWYFPHSASTFSGQERLVYGEYLDQRAVV